MVTLLQEQSDKSLAPIYHYHIRKTGGTSLNHMFLALDGGDSVSLYEKLSSGPVLRGDRIYVGFDKDLIGIPGYFYGFSHAPQDRVSLPSGTYTIVCFRDPVSRVVALYSQFVHYKNENIVHPSRKFADKWVKEGFLPFLDLADPAFIFNQLGMFSRELSVDQAIENASKVHFAFRTEHFAESIPELAARLGLPLQPLHLRKHSHRVRIAEQDLNAARQKMSLEYSFLGKFMGEAPWKASGVS